MNEPTSKTVAKFYRLVIRPDDRQKLVKDFNTVTEAIAFVSTWCSPVVIHGKLVPTPVRSILITEEEIVSEYIETGDVV